MDSDIISKLKFPAYIALLVFISVFAGFDSPLELSIAVAIGIMIFFTASYFTEDDYE